MAWLKLPNVGDSVVFVIKQLGETNGTDSLCFSDTGGDLVYIPKAVALARLRDLGFAIPGTATVDFDRVIGTTLRFSKLAPEIVGGRPRWMIERETAHAEDIVIAPPRIAAPAAHTHSDTERHMDTGTIDKQEKRQHIHAVYEEALVAALAIQKKIFKGKLAPKITAESVAASAATMFIQYERNRCL